MKKDKCGVYQEERSKPVACGILVNVDINATSIPYASNMVEERKHSRSKVTSESYNDEHDRNDENDLRNDSGSSDSDNPLSRSFRYLSMKGFNERTTTDKQGKKVEPN